MGRTSQATLPWDSLGGDWEALELGLSSCPGTVALLTFWKPCSWPQ